MESDVLLMGEASERELAMVERVKGQQGLGNECPKERRQEIKQMLMLKLSSASAYMSEWRRRGYTISLLVGSIGRNFNTDGRDHMGIAAFACILYLLSKLILYSNFHLSASRHTNALPPSSSRLNLFFDFLHSLVNISCGIAWQAHQWMLRLFFRLQRVLIPLPQLFDKPRLSWGGKEGH